MSASASTESENQETHPHPPMPAVTDEAADTPMWVPISGVVMFVLLLLFAMMRASMSAPEAAESDAPAAEGVVVAPAAP
jgi:hypothetical protein